MQGSPLSVYPQSCGMGKFNKADDDDKKYSPSCQGRIYVANGYLTFTRSISIFSQTFRIFVTNYLEYEKNLPVFMKNRQILEYNLQIFHFSITLKISTCCK